MRRSLFCSLSMLTSDKLTDMRRRNHLPIADISEMAGLDARWAEYGLDQVAATLAALALTAAGLPAQSASTIVARHVPRSEYAKAAPVAGKQRAKRFVVAGQFRVEGASYTMHRVAGGIGKAPAEKIPLSFTSEKPDQMPALTLASDDCITYVVLNLSLLLQDLHRRAVELSITLDWEKNDAFHADSESA